MKHVFPASFKELWKDPTIKMACISDIQPGSKADCENCGGIGHLYTFISKIGPLASPSPSDTTKFISGKWWVGNNISGECPVCKGSGKDPDYKEQPVRQPRELPDLQEVLK